MSKTAAQGRSQVLSTGRLRRRSAKTPAWRDSSKGESLEAKAISATLKVEACSSTTARADTAIIAAAGTLLMATFLVLGMLASPVGGLGLELRAGGL